MTEQQDFIDSHVPIDEEVCTHADWPLPEPRKWEPAANPTWREKLRELVGRMPF